MVSLNDVYLNLTSEEFGEAKQWYDHLRDPEQDRVLGVLALFNEREFNLRRDEITRFAIIVAGSSIDTEGYTDIDLFALSENPLHLVDGPYGGSHPKRSIGRNLGISYDYEGDASGDLPERVYFIIYGETDLRREPNGQELIERGLGARVTISLFYELENGHQRRPDHPDDLLEPKEPMGAEELMNYNREMGSKFLVLSRQYEN
ncbi:MAG: hypothetical protein ISS48_03720 [Candidatus Aenigmarchaeota archaeon]|nr:hypothetical protein [Candidatus Aenigmarchaeota archaeon]